MRNLTSSSIETDRLVLRALRPGDAPFIFRLLNDPAWLEFIGDRGIRELSDAEEYVRSGPLAMYAEHECGLFLVETRGNRVAIGLCGLLWREWLDDLDLGFALLPEFHGNGYAVESSRAWLCRACEVGQTRVLAHASAQNIASVRVLERLGFRFQQLVMDPASGDELARYAVDLPTRSRDE
ncbi:MAG: GNAT family N-acetyltransferase, partial [Planctomycetota bacterium]